MGKKYKMLIGIDPGTTGGIASMLYDRKTQHGKVIRAVKMPKTALEFNKYIRYLIHSVENDGYAILIERVGMMPSDASNIGRMMRVQKMIGNYHKMLASIEISGFTLKTVESRQWQTKITGNNRVEYDRQKRKHQFKLIAEGIFKNLKPTLATGDALCILEYLRRRYNENENVICQQTNTTLL